MKKAILLIVVVLSAIASYSQCMLGYTEAQVRKEKPTAIIRSEYGKNGAKYITYDNPSENKKFKFSWTHYFNNNGAIIMSILIPRNPEGYISVVEIFNNRFVIKSSTEWVMYEDGLPISVNLVYHEETGIYYFKYEFIE